MSATAADRTRRCAVHQSGYGRRRWYAGIQNCTFPISRSRRQAAAFADTHGVKINLHKPDVRAEQGAWLRTLRLVREHTETGRTIVGGAVKLLRLMIFMQRGKFCTNA